MRNNQFLASGSCRRSLITPYSNGLRGIRKSHQAVWNGCASIRPFYRLQAPLRDLIGSSHGVSPERVIVGNGGLEVISLFFKSLPRESNIIVEEASYDRVVLDAKCYGHRLIGVKLTPEGVDLNQFRDMANGRLPSRRICKAEVHWYEAHGIGRKKMKIKRILE